MKPDQIIPKLVSEFPNKWAHAIHVMQRRSGLSNHDLADKTGIQGTRLFDIIEAGLPPNSEELEAIATACGFQWTIIPVTTGPDLIEKLESQLAEMKQIFAATEGDTLFTPYGPTTDGNA